MNSPVFSIVIPVYNGENFLSRAIDSVLNQSISDFELVIVNDGSTDNSPNIVKKYNDSRIKLIEQTNRGVGDARNKGISISDSNYIALLDADDEWNENFLQEIKRLINKFPQAGMYVTSYSINTGSNIVKIKKSKHTKYKLYEMNYFKEAYYGNNPVLPSAACIPKLTLDNVGPFLTGITHGEDLEMWARIALKYQIAYSTKKCVIYNKNTGFNVSRKPYLKRLALVETLQKSFVQENFPERKVFYINEYIASCDLIHAKDLIIQNYKKEAKNILKLCKTQDQRYKLFILKTALYFPRPLILFVHKLIRIIRNFRQDYSWR